MQSKRSWRGDCVSALAVTLVLLMLVPVAQGQLIGVEANTGTLYSISTGDATLTEIGPTGLSGLGALEFNAHDGLLYGMTSGEHAALYRIGVSPSLDQVLSVDLVGEVGMFAFEGGLAFAPDGTAYAVNGGVTIPALLTLNLNTGAFTASQLLDGRYDIAGLGWRSDGMLVGLDSETNMLITIDAGTGVTAPVHAAPTIGTVGGVYLEDDSGYFATAALGAIFPGSNALYEFDAITGDYSLIGDFSGTFDTTAYTGMSGLAIIPEPATLGLVLIGCCAVLRRRGR